MQIISLVGARPQFIKESVLHEEFKKAGIREMLVNSGQHYDHNMSGVFFDELGIRQPDFNLGIGSGTHAEMTGRTMIAFEEIVLAHKPEIIVVYGDTNTTLAGALVGAKLKVPVAHIEAGVRMFPKDMPEEINRVLTDRVSKLLFCSSQRCVANLKNENIIEGVYFTGDVTYDLFLKLRGRFKFDLIEKLNLSLNQFAVMTLHRDYNVDDPQRFKNILSEVQKLSQNLKIVFPIHPRTKKRIEEFQLGHLVKDLLITEPLDYLNLMGLVERSRFVITDSGGLQKEAYYADKASFLFMFDPAWHELVEEGINFIVGENNLCELVDNLHQKTFRKGIYGNGKAGSEIVECFSKLAGQL